MNNLTQTKKFATTIGAEAWARDVYKGEFPVAVQVTIINRRKGLVKKAYVISRRPTNADFLQPVGVLKDLNEIA